MISPRLGYQNGKKEMTYLKIMNLKTRLEKVKLSVNVIRRSTEIVKISGIAESGANALNFDHVYHVRLRA